MNPPWCRLNVARIPANRASRRAPGLRIAWTAALLLVAPCAWSDCTVGAQGVSFGSYDPFADQDSDGAGNIAVTCDAGLAYSIALSAGGGSHAARAMASGPHTLGYNLFTDPARTTVWGDGTGATATVGGTGTGITANVTVYGRVPARQNAHVGGYSDAIVVTVTF